MASALVQKGKRVAREIRSTPSVPATETGSRSHAAGSLLLLLLLRPGVAFEKLPAHCQLVGGSFGRGVTHASRLL